MRGGIAEEAGARIVQTDPRIHFRTRYRQPVTGAVGDANVDPAQAGARRRRQPLDRIAVIAAARQGIGRREGAVQSKRQAAVIVAPTSFRVI